MRTARLHPRRMPRRRWLVLTLALALLSPALFSYAAMATQPSSLPLGVRSVEWVRANHGNWLVDEAERVYYGRLHAPRKGGPALTALPKVGLPTAPTPGAPGGHPTSGAALPNVRPAAVKPAVAPALPGEGLWRPTGPDVAGGPPVLVTTFRPERSYPAIVAYVAWFDHTRTHVAYYPGRYEPPKAAVRGRRRCRLGSVPGSWRASTPASSTPMG